MNMLMMNIFGMMIHSTDEHFWDDDTFGGVVEKVIGD